MKLSLRHLASVGTLAGLLALPSLALAQGDQPQPQPQPAPAGGDSTEKKTDESGPTVSLGTSPSKDSTTKEEAKAETKEEEKLRWAGTSLTSQLSTTTTTIAPAQQLTQASTVESWFLFVPIFSIHKNWEARGRFTLTYEWTDTAGSGTTTRNEPQFGDSIGYLYFKGLPEVPKLGIKTKVGVVAALPTSKLSWARTLYVSPGLTAGFSKSFEKVGKGSIALSASATLSHPIYESTTSRKLDAPPYAASCFPGPTGDSGSCTNQLSGTANAENILSFLVSAGGEWPLSKGMIKPSAFFLMSNSWAYQFKDLPGVERLGDRTNFRQSTFFNVSLDYDFWGPMKWLGAEVGYYMVRNILDGNGRIANPFFDTMQDMRIYVAANIAIDELYLSIAGKQPKTKEAKREPQPIPGGVAAVH